MLVSFLSLPLRGSSMSGDVHRFLDPRSSGYQSNWTVSRQTAGSPHKALRTQQQNPALSVVVPCFNEVENLQSILDRLRASVPTAHALVVDDGSPDGTGELADKIAAGDPRAATTTKSSM